METPRDECIFNVNKQIWIDLSNTIWVLENNQLGILPNMSPSGFLIFLRASLSKSSQLYLRGKQSSGELLFIYELGKCPLEGGQSI